MQHRNRFLPTLLTALVLTAALSGCAQKSDEPVTTVSSTAASTAVVTTTAKEETQQATTLEAVPGLLVYKNTQYGFSFVLPVSWKGYTIVTDQWEGVGLPNSASRQGTETGPIINIRHPLWTAANPRQDIPVMVFTLAQWALLQNQKFSVGAAPIPPSELGRNTTYVFALPARYNYAFLTGFEEVETILAGNPLQAY